MNSQQLSHRELKACATGSSSTHLCKLQNQQLHRHIVADFLALQTAASKAGFTLSIASSFRDFDRQRTIWNAKFNQQRPVFDLNQQVVDLSRLTELQKCHAIMLYSALPGASRHHFGTDLDVFDQAAIATDYKLQLTTDEYQGDGPFKAMTAWLDSHLVKFGFYRPYHHYLGGVAAEPWHISHIKQSTLMLNSLTLNALFERIECSDVAGKATILQHLPALYKRFVINVNPPP
ncbi:M15 family metallopeptidase [Pseudoalteromonas mariniglutinosa]|uniref:M15 family metallopeptidase n=1 Tax=Pseudoalteromonas mariniglutinosa TaxID=206042 RepID=UPI00384AA292